MLEWQASLSLIELELGLGKLHPLRNLGTEDEARLQAATPEMLDRYLQRLLTSDSLAAVFED